MRLKVKVTSWKTNTPALGKALVTQTPAGSALLNKANEIAENSKLRVLVNSLPSELQGENWKDYRIEVPNSSWESGRPKYFSRRLDNIANAIHVGGMEGPLISTKFKRKGGVPTMVALVAYDHPYHRLYRTQFTAAVVASSGGNFRIRAAR